MGVQGLEASTRSLAWFGTPDPQMHRALAQAGWRVVAIDPCGDDAAAMIRGIDAWVALVEFDAETPLRLVEQLASQHPEVQWLALVQPDELAKPAVRDLIRFAFFDYFTPPLDVGQLGLALGHAWGKARLGRVDGAPKAVDLDGMVGASRAMHALALRIRKFVPVDVAVLVTGETGTGKELAARTLHRLSARASGPFVAINCGALPEKLVQSELFGHERGAFTDAATRKIGRIEAAHGGTVFLDEIGDLPLEAQANLLRFLQDGTIERVGGHQPIRVDARVVAATHVDLERAVAEGSFREDLYYRLNVLRLHMPSLRERNGDVELLAHHFLDAFRREHGTRVRGFTQAAKDAMAAYPWPGNVRELMNRVRRAAVMADGPLITPAHLELAEPDGMLPAFSLESARDSAERDMILDCLRESRFNVSECARRLKVSRVTVYRLCKKHGLARSRTSSADGP
ncbi:two component, sigma54 specific, transcriptional regulator, Fis family [Mizugakiibacter sediminis]|uniref:Fis family transcriptional regulator n=1 Tax=Mizugakiibacter sediminis TaxID=1475481 RepID=A0A0K8QJS6_9GAMM|nr:sigma-54 dependent transcriptional regulator [Mizugakiibacter sediminis]GAP65165.1 two component, sigma54 specific, transcriptional regulator, Fis family [Mizugakiibacter sediminis]